jgi:hypothetical protein
MQRSACCDSRLSYEKHIETTDRLPLLQVSSAVGAFGNAADIATIGGTATARPFSRRVNGAVIAEYTVRVERRQFGAPGSVLAQDIGDRCLTT